MRDPRVGLCGISAGIGLLSALFLGMIGQHWAILPLPLATVSVLLLINMGGGPLRPVLTILQAIILGLLSLPLMLNGTGVITLMGCLFAVAAIFYHTPAAEAPMPEWLQTRRVRRRRMRHRSGTPPTEVAEAAPGGVQPPDASTVADDSGTLSGALVEGTPQGAPPSR